MATIELTTSTTAEARIFHMGEWQWSLAITIKHEDGAELVLSMRGRSPIYRHVTEFSPQAVVDIVIDADIYDSPAALRADTNNVFDELNGQLFVEDDTIRPFKCVSYNDDRELPSRAIGVNTVFFTTSGELVLLAAYQSRAGLTELRMALGDQDAQAVLSETITGYVIDDMIAELGGGYSPVVSHMLATELNAGLHEARYSEELKAGRLARDLAELPGRSKLLAKLSQVTV